MKTCMAGMALLAALAATAVESAGEQARGHSATVQLRSAFVESAQYDLDRHILTVRLANGRAYEYRDVPESTFSALVNTDKPGRFFTRHIRGVYPTRRMGDPDDALLASSCSRIPNPVSQE